MCWSIFKTVVIFWIHLWQTPKATLEIKDMGVDISKDEGSKPSMYLKLQISPIAIHLGEQHVSDNILCSSNDSESLSAGNGSMIDKSSAHFICEEFGLLVDFGPHRFLFSIYIYFFSISHIYMLCLNICSWTSKCVQMSVTMFSFQIRCH